MSAPRGLARAWLVLALALGAPPLVAPLAAPLAAQRRSDAVSAASGAIAPAAPSPTGGPTHAAVAAVAAGGDSAGLRMRAALSPLAPLAPRAAGEGAPRGRAPLWAPLASAAVPGLGQAALGQPRFVAYLALETFAWIRFANDLAEGRRRRDEYRRIASEVARALYSDRRPVGDFEYYEKMEQFLESGVYDVVPGGGLDPETDTLTYNGLVWRLARQTYWADADTPPDPSDPSLASALDFYERRAIQPDFRWSWRGAQLEQDLFRRTITRSNEAFRRSVTDLGLILANHVLSTVDASIEVRLRRRTTTPPVPVGLGGGGWDVEASLPWPRAGR